MAQGATLIGTSGLGHSDLLEHPQVIAKVLDFEATGRGKVRRMQRWSAGW